MFFLTWVMFWKIHRIYIFFFSMRNIKSNCQIMFLKHFPIIFWWKISFFLVTFIYKTFNFCYFWGILFQWSWFNATVTAYWKHLLIIFFIDRIYCCFWNFYPGRRIYIWSTMIRIYFMALIIQLMNINLSSKSLNHFHIYYGMIHNVFH